MAGGVRTGRQAVGAALEQLPPAVQRGLRSTPANSLVCEMQPETSLQPLTWSKGESGPALGDVLHQSGGLMGLGLQVPLPLKAVKNSLPSRNQWIC